tara:strand:- start:324 stop:647 length:324 start_codon:yes stop_codon:yes gene_type:complete
MNVARKIENSENSHLKNKRMGIKEKFRNPQFIIDEISQYVKEGDIAASTDLISAYISNSLKYSNQADFAEAIGTTRQTLHRMFAHENVNLNIFFNAIEQIYDDANEL